MNAKTLARSLALALLASLLPGTTLAEDAPSFGGLSETQVVQEEDQAAGSQSELDQFYIEQAWAFVEADANPKRQVDLKFVKGMITGRRKTTFWKEDVVDVVIIYTYRKSGLRIHGAPDIIPFWISRVTEQDETQGVVHVQVPTAGGKIKILSSSN